MNVDVALEDPLDVARSLEGFPRKAVGAACFDGRLSSEAEVREATAHWGAAAGVAQQVLPESLSGR